MESRGGVALLHASPALFVRRLFVGNGLSHVIILQPGLQPLALSAILFMSASSNMVLDINTTSASDTQVSFSKKSPYNNSKLLVSAGACCHCQASLKVYGEREQLLCDC